METENNTETVVETTTATETPKVRKPRSPNKPKTLEKLGLLANKHMDRLYDKRDELVTKASDRVKEKFVAKVTEYLDTLSPEVRALVTGVERFCVDPGTEEAAE